MFELNGNVAVVTGASAGLGRQFALALAKQGANLAILARRKEKLDAVAEEIFVATGSLPCIPRSVNIQETDKVIDVTQAHIHGVKGQKVVICGGGLSGCDTALELAMQGKEVTIVEQMENCARDVMAINKISLDTLLAQYQVKILTNTKVTEISDKGVTAETEDGSIPLEADAIVTAFGQKANSKTADAIASRYPCKTTLIGDCQKPSKAGKAIREGFYAAMALQ